MMYSVWMLLGISIFVGHRSICSLMQLNIRSINFSALEPTGYIN